MATTTTPVRRGNPLVRVLLSLGMLALMLYIVIRQGKPPKKEFTVANFRSSAPSSEGDRSFAWIPHYPGAMVANIRTKVTESVLTYGFDFRTADGPDAVVDFFERSLRGAGFTVNTRRPNGDEAILIGESRGPSRSIDIAIDKVQTGTIVTVSAEEK
jgi:hypothetical protein